MLSMNVKYGLDLLSFLSHQDRTQYISVSQIGKDYPMSSRQAQIILERLRLAGLVDSRPGRQGGHRLVMDPKKITLLKVIEAIDGPSHRNSNARSVGERAEQALQRTARTWTLRGKFGCL